MAYTIADKAIRFRQDYNPDGAQKLISSSMSRHLSTRNISSKSMHAFLSNLANKYTDRLTDKRGQTHLPHSLSEVIIVFNSDDKVRQCGRFIPYRERSVT